MSFPFYRQPDEMDCGPTCLRMVAKHYGKNYTLRDLRQLASTTRSGSSLLGISEAAEKIGFRTIGFSNKMMLYPKPKNELEQQMNRRVEINVISID